ncbi:unnamed protein product [Phytomonas sp. Hart1]|nr:unnamed protein product [Phytomonas sp. Hart1]|eukprot:CCW70276.1 unnamed protein product [Phytomonas sp. isolate Hart1]
MSGGGFPVNPRLIKAQYAVRGLVPSRAKMIQKEIDEGSTKYPFSELIWCNIGNPQAVKQKPITFHRQVMSLFDAPFLLDMPEILAHYPTDVVERAKYYLEDANGVTGAYTDSLGYTFARKAVAEYINKRDHHIQPEVTYDDIVLTDGASSGLRFILEVMMSGSRDGTMTPIPQYPLYTALLALLDAQCIPYYLREEDNWSVRIEELKESYNKSISEGVTPRVFVCINPNNPTGNLLSRNILEEMVKFCHDRSLLLLADEVYQLNIHSDGLNFVSFREVVLSMPEPYRSGTMLVSMNSASKGILGECGRRGGYLDLLNIPREVREQLIKLCSMNLCSNVNGQLMIAVMCTPPQEGDPSYELYASEYQAVVDGHRIRASALAKELNTIPGISSQSVMAAMYAFPTIKLPAKWVEVKMAQQGKEGGTLKLDECWALELLEKTGIVVVPGSGFEQVPGTLHFRTTILPPSDQMKKVIQGIRQFQEDLYEKFV